MRVHCYVISRKVEFGARNAAIEAAKRFLGRKYATLGSQLWRPENLLPKGIFSWKTVSKKKWVHVVKGASKNDPGWPRGNHYINEVGGNQHGGSGRGGWDVRMSYVFMSYESSKSY